MSCSNGSSPIVIGETTESQLLAENGAPNREYKPRPHGGNSKSKVYVFKDDFYQTDDGVVTAHLRDPKNQEVSLQYWLDKWNKAQVHWDVIKPEALSHDQDLAHYRATGLGEGVVYRPSRKSVERVYYFQANQ